MSSVSEFLEENDVMVTMAMTTLIAMLSIFFFFQQRQYNRKQLLFENNDANKQQEEKPLKNVFDTFRQNHSSSSASIGKNHHPDGKPFGSSYYYAHNNPNAKGGYKDGLRMEDYVMNQPRLLSVDGKVVDSNVETDTNTTISSESITSPKTTTKTQTSNKKSSNPSILKDSLPINRYLWDDDNLNNDGIAKVLIETLPTSDNGTITWEDANISKNDVKSKIIQNNDESCGLLVQIVSNNDSVTKKYHLLVPKLHGQVNQIKCIVKSKRLILKVYKAKGKKFQIWPQLAAKDSNAIKDYSKNIDQDLFLNG